jgi:phenylacetic acid degradation operon negative regulatory protein
MNARSPVSDLIGDRRFTARSVLASALLGADEPRLPVALLVAAASLFGISEGAARTCLWRMVSDGELTSEDGTYALAGHLLERRQRVDDAAGEHDARPWDGTWEIAVVCMERRPAADRLELRKAAQALHLAEIREGVWIRPDNLDPHRLPSSRAVLQAQCVMFHGTASDIGADTVSSLFALEKWAHDARRLTAAMRDELDKEAAELDRAALTSQFMLSISVVRHLQADPVLPTALLPRPWAADDLRATYRRFDRAFKRRMNSAARSGQNGR